MKIIKQGDSRVTKIIAGKNLEKGGKYKVSQFVYPFSEDGRHLLYSTFTKETVKLTDTEWKAFQKIKAAPVSYDYIAKNGLEQLTLSRYIVETNYDEIGQYNTSMKTESYLRTLLQGVNTETDDDDEEV